MPKKKNNLKTLIIILAVVIVIAVVFKLLSSKSANNLNSSGVGLVTSSATGNLVRPGVIAEDGISATTAQSNELVLLLKSVSTLTLPNTIFTNPIFEVLQDISSRVRIEGDPGRVNPFLPIGQDTMMMPFDINAFGEGAGGGDVSIIDPTALQTFLNNGEIQ